MVSTPILINVLSCYLCMRIHLVSKWVNCMRYTFHPFCLNFLSHAIHLYIIILYMSCQDRLHIIFTCHSFTFLLTCHLKINPMSFPHVILGQITFHLHMSSQDRSHVILRQFLSMLYFTCTYILFIKCQICQLSYKMVKFKFKFKIRYFPFGQALWGAQHILHT